MRRFVIAFVETITLGNHRYPIFLRELVTLVKHVNTLVRIYHHHLSLFLRFFPRDFYRSLKILLSMLTARSIFEHCTCRENSLLKEKKNYFTFIRSPDRDHRSTFTIYALAKISLHEAGLFPPQPSYEKPSFRDAGNMERSSRFSNAVETSVNQPTDLTNGICLARDTYLFPRRRRVRIEPRVFEHTKRRQRVTGLGTILTID